MSLLIDAVRTVAAVSPFRVRRLTPRPGEEHLESNASVVHHLQSGAHVRVIVGDRPSRPPANPLARPRAGIRASASSKARARMVVRVDVDNHAFTNKLAISDPAHLVRPALCAAASDQGHATCHDPQTIHPPGAPFDSNHTWQYSFRSQLMDVRNLSILRHLMRDGRATWADLAVDLGLTAPAIAQRVRRLQDRGIIRHFRSAGRTWSSVADIRVRWRLGRHSQCARQLPE